MLVLEPDALERVDEGDGREAGDALLRRAATILLTGSGRDATLARLDHDTFAVLLVEPDAEAAKTVRCIARELAEAGLPASVGASARPDVGDPTKACRSADAAMYADKRR